MNTQTTISRNGIITRWRATGTAVDINTLTNFLKVKKVQPVVINKTAKQTYTFYDMSVVDALRADYVRYRDARWPKAGTSLRSLVNGKKRNVSENSIAAGSKNIRSWTTMLETAARLERKLDIVLKELNIKVDDE